MRLKNKTKIFGNRIISMLMAIIMTMSLAVMNVSAAPVDTSAETEEHRAKIGIDYLGEGNAPMAKAQTLPNLVGTSSAAKYFWFGIYISDLKTMSDYYKSITAADGTGGISKFTAQIEYASNLVVYRTPSQAPTSNADNAWYAALPEWNRSYTYTDPDMGMDETAVVKDSYKVSYGSASSTLTTDGREPQVIKDGDVPKSAMVTVELSTLKAGAKGVASRIFGNELTNDKQYMAVFCFALPAGKTIAPGTPLISLGRNTMLVMKTADVDGTEKSSLAWHTSRINTPDGNMKNYFDYQGDPVLAPQSYTVNFYNSYDATNGYGAQITGFGGTVSEGKSIDTMNATIEAEADKIKIPAASDFNPETGKYYGKLQYIDKDGNPQDFKSDTVLKSDMFADGDTTLKVFATYINGHDVKFHVTYPEGASSTPTELTVTTSPVRADSKIAATDVPVFDGTADNFATLADGWVLDGWYTTPTFNAGTKVVFATGADGETPTLFAPTTEGGTDGYSDVYANFVKAHKITFYKNDNPQGEVAEVKAEAQALPNEAIAPSSSIPTNAGFTVAGWDRAGYKIVKWSSARNGNDSATNYTPAEMETAKFDAADAAKTFYAIWEPTDLDAAYTVTFDKNAPTGETIAEPSPASVSVVPGDTIYGTDVPTYADTANYKFEGWYDSASITATKIDFDAGYTPTKDTTVYAHWTYSKTDGTQATIKFWKNDGTTETEPYATATVKKGTALGEAAMPALPTKTDSTCTGWNTQSDGKGTKFEATTAIGDDMEVYATYAKDIIVVYDANGGSNPPVMTKAVPVDTPYADPDVTAMTPKSYNGKTYTFIGWNTMPNGSGVNIKAGTTYDTYAKVLAAGAAAYTTDSSVTLFAQWAAVPDTPDDKEKVEDDDPDDPPTPDPSKDSVHITFHSNATTEEPVTIEVNRQTLDEVYGNTLGAMMPTKPERDKYDWASWNTKPDGTGETFTATTAISNDVLKGAVKENAAPNEGTYTLDLYAQWTIKSDVPESDKVKVIFNKNLNGDGVDADLASTTYELVKGDKLPFVPSGPANGNLDFNGWYKGSLNGSELELVTTDKFDEAARSTTTFTDKETTYYAEYVLYIWAELQPFEVKDSTKVYDKTYTGNTIEPNYKLYKAKDGGEGSDPVKVMPEVELYSGKLSAAADFSYEFSSNGTKTTTPTDVGKYTLATLTAKDGGAYANHKMQLYVAPPTEFEITKIKLNIQIDPDKQKVKKEDTMHLIDSTDVTLSSDSAALVDSHILGNVVYVTYYTWTDGNGDGEIQLTELSSKVTPSDVGKYVMVIAPRKLSEGEGTIDYSSMYMINSVTSSVDGKVVTVYPKEGTSTLPLYPTANPGENLYFEIEPNDPSLKSAVVVSAKEDKDSTDDPKPLVTSAPLDLKDSDYDKSKPLDTTSDAKDEGGNDIDRNYYVRVTDTDAEKTVITVELTNPDTTNVTAKLNGVDVPATDIVRSADGKTVTITVPLDKKGKEANEVVITTTAGTGETAPKLENTFHIQQMVVPKIVLRYGNSPVGQIMKDNKTYPTWAAKSAAIDAFRSTRKFDGVKQDVENEDFSYYAHAWLSQKLSANDTTTGENAVTDETRSYYEYTDDEGNVVGKHYYGTFYQYVDYVNAEEVPREGTFYNGDDDPTSIFVYHRQNFQDVGFDAYDSLGERVDDDKVTSHLVMKTFYEVDDGNGGFPVFDESDSRVNVSGVDETHTGNMQYFTQPETKDVCPDVYEMTYSFEDPYLKNEDGTKKKVTQTRKVIAIARNGDVYMNAMNTINPQDVSALEEHFTFFGQNKDKYSVYIFRIADVLVNDMFTINPQDSSKVDEYLGKPVHIFYNTLPTTTIKDQNPFNTKTELYGTKQSEETE